MRIIVCDWIEFNLWGVSSSLVYDTYLRGAGSLCAACLIYLRGGRDNLNSSLCSCPEYMDIMSSWGTKKWIVLTRAFTYNYPILLIAQHFDVSGMKGGLLAIMREGISTTVSIDWFSLLLATRHYTERHAEHNIQNSCKKYGYFKLCTVFYAK